MSEPMARRRILVDYRIRASRCTECGRTYFPPKSFCNVEGRGSRMNQVDYVNGKGMLVSGSVSIQPTNKFLHSGSYLSGIVSFNDEARNTRKDH